MLPRVILLVLEFTCIALALALVCLFFKVYNRKRSIFLLGLPFGFFFLMLSYVFLGLYLVDLTFESVNPLSSLIMWLRVIIQTIGFALIAFSYFSAGRYQNITKYTYSIILIGSMGLVFSLFGALYFVNPSDLASVYTDINLFSIVNIALLSYVILFLSRKLQLSSRRVSGLTSAPLAFACLWLGQLSLLIYALAGGGDAALLGSQVARVVGLALFLRMYYLASKERSTDAGEQTEQS